ncbi:MAG TPA: hypothetical protein VIJ77_10420 [Candidatus Tumulicola sp.]
MMRIAKSATRAFGVLLAIGLLAGCGGGSGSGTSPVSQLAPMPALANAGSWMAPGAKNMNLLYVADLDRNAVVVYSYPDGRPMGTLTGFAAPLSECVDKAGDVFVADGRANSVLEYAHGGTAPIATFNVPGFPHGCAVDPITGNLAILHDPLSSGPGAISIFKHAKGTPKEYTTPNVFRVYFLGYDNKGNLFVDGTDMHVGFEFAELPAGSKTAKAITLDQAIVLPGAIAWDGKHLAVGDQVSIFGPSTIYEFSINGDTGTETGATPLANSCDVLQFWLANKNVIVANDCSHNVMYFNYPKGGQSIKGINELLLEPVGVTISSK